MSVMQGSHAPEPVAEARRVDDIDVLRGMALCGVLVSNLVEVFRVPWGRVYEVPGGGRIDEMANFLMYTAFQGNTITFFFSLMFGLGMAISSGRISKSGASSHRFWGHRFWGHRFLVRKQLVLLAIGLVHGTLIWNGDVLVSYAVVGFCLLPLLRYRPRTLVLLALLALIVFVLPIFPKAPPSTSGEQLHRVTANLEVYQHGNWLEVHTRRIADLKFMYHYVVIRSWAAELAAFCLGAGTWYSGILAAPGKHLRVLWGAALLGIVSLAVICGIESKLLPGWRGAGPVLRFGYNLAYFELAFAYGACILLSLQRPFWRQRLLWIAPLGRMSLSNYLMQSIVFGFIFYGYGLGQFGKLPTAVTAAGGLAFYVVQVVLSAIWLRHFQFGPVEWVWRTLSYGRLQAFRKLSPAVGTPAAERAPSS